MTDLWQISRRQSRWPENAEMVIEAAPRMEWSTVARHLYVWHRRMQQANSMYFSSETTRGCRKHIIYWFRWQNDADREYDATHYDCLSVVLAILAFCRYQEGCQFSVKTDHDILNRISSLIESIDMLMHRQVLLPVPELYHVHHSGINQQAADALSRLNKTLSEQTPIDVDITGLCSTSLFTAEKRQVLGICTIAT